MRTILVWTGPSVVWRGSAMGTCFRSRTRHKPLPGTPWPYLATGNETRIHPATLNFRQLPGNTLSIEVTDNPSKSRFEAVIADELAIADYNIVGDTYAIYHTEVPHHLRGNGYGGALVRGALDIIKERNQRVDPICPFVRAFIRDNPEYSDLIVGTRQ